MRVVVLVALHLSSCHARKRYQVVEEDGSVGWTRAKKAEIEAELEQKWYTLEEQAQEEIMMRRDTANQSPPFFSNSSSAAEESKTGGVDMRSPHSLKPSSRMSMPT